MATARLTRAESKAATRSDLVDAARRVVVQRGYHGASLDLVAREAGYTKGAVYSAFGSKGQMFLAVWEREVERRWSRIERETLGRSADEVPATAGEDWMRRLQRERDWTLAVLEFRLHAARDPELNALYAAGHRRVIDRFTTVLERAGVEAPRSREIAITVVALSNGWALEHLAIPDDATEERYAAAATALIESLRR